MSYYDNANKGSGRIVWNDDGTYRYVYDEEPNGSGGNYKAPKKEKKGLGFFGKVVVGALIFGLISGGVAFGTFKAGLTFVGGPKEEAPVSKTEPKSGKTKGGLSGTAVSSAVAINDVSDIAKNVMPSIVQVTNMSVVEYRGFFGQIYSEPREEAGSGFIIAEDDANIYIATNNHVVSNSRDMTVTFSNDEAVSAEVQGTYPEKDVAVVKVDKSKISDKTIAEILVATISDEEPAVGQATVAIGNALGYGQSVTTGVISALNRPVSLRDDTGQVISNELIQTDAAINPGNSGGALLNMNGQVIGIVSAKYSSTEVEGMGYAIPISVAKTIIDEIISTGSYTGDGEVTDDTQASNGAYLGIYGGMDIDEATGSRYSMPTGVYVSQVVDGSAAQKAGIKSGDVIRKIDDRDISSMSALKSAISKKHPGEIVKLNVAIAGNNYRDTDVQVVLGEMPKK